ncbi:hypothetical protein FQR65_LT20599 [Abscondita terminalis]|nr:hypothetical protein FQR65_LT20599 [Abscondita terminalis]
MHPITEHAASGKPLSLAESLGAAKVWCWFKTASVRHIFDGQATHTVGRLEISRAHLCKSRHYNNIPPELSATSLFRDATDYASSKRSYPMHVGLTLDLGHVARAHGCLRTCALDSANESHHLPTFKDMAWMAAGTDCAAFVDIPQAWCRLFTQHGLRHTTPQFANAAHLVSSDRSETLIQARFNYNQDECFGDMGMAQIIRDQADKALRAILGSHIIDLAEFNHQRYFRSQWHI